MWLQFFSDSVQSLARLEDLSSGSNPFWEANPEEWLSSLLKRAHIECQKTNNLLETDRSLRQHSGADGLVRARPPDRQTITFEPFGPMKRDLFFQKRNPINNGNAGPRTNVKQKNDEKRLGEQLPGKQLIRLKRKASSTAGGSFENVSQPGQETLLRRELSCCEFLWINCPG